MVTSNVFLFQIIDYLTVILMKPLLLPSTQSDTSSIRSPTDSDSNLSIGTFIIMSTEYFTL